MPKRSADAQLTKDDMNNGFNFGNMEGSENNAFSTPPPAAGADAMSKRKIAPLKRRGGRGGAATPGRSTPSNLPNVFASIGTNSFSGSGSNGTPQPAGQPAFSGFGTPSGPTTPTGFGNGTSGFAFGQQEQPKPSNPFGSLAPSPAPSPAPTNGTSGGIFGNNSFGTPNTAPASNGMFGNNTATTGANSAASTPATSFGAFGSNTNDTTKPFAFGSTSNAPPTPAAGGMFGSSNTDSPKPFTFGMPADKKPEEPKPTPSFAFGASTATPAPAETPKAAPSFTFGASTATPAPAETPKAAPSFTFGGSTASTPTPAINFGTSTNDAKPTAGFGFGQSSTPSGGSLFGKPAESKPAEPAPTNSLFGKPTPSPEPTTPSANFFEQKPADKPLNSFFGKPADQSTSTPSGFGASTTKVETEKKADEPAKQPMFGGTFGSTSKKADEPAKQPMFGGTFGGTPKKDDSKPLFGFGSAAAPEKKDDPKPAFGGFGTPATEKKPETASSMFGSGAVEKKPESAPPMFGSSFGSGSAMSGSMFGQQKVDKPEEKPTEKPADKPATNAFSAGTPSFGFKPSTPAADSTPLFAPKPAGLKPSVDAPVATNDGRTSPPLPPDSHNWSASQLTEYYNLFAMRSLNHFFKEALSKADVMADLTPLCEKYQEEAKKITQMIANNQRYKFGEGSVASTVPGKRAAGESDGRNAKRTRPLGEESQKAPSFAPSPGKSSSSQALASILGGGSSTSDSVTIPKKPAFSFQPPTGEKVASTVKMADKPSFGFTPPTSTLAPPKEPEKKKSPAASIFDSPSPGADSLKSSWDNPFTKPVDTSNIPDDVEDDDDESTPKLKPSGGLFGRVSTPGGDKKSSIFSGGDQTWSSDKGVKFSGSSSSGLFSNSNSTITGGLFGNTTTSTSSTPFSFTPKASAAASPAATTGGTSASASDTEPTADGEPSDNPPPAATDSDFARKRGEGEEDEDVNYEAKAILYDFTNGKADKKGVGIFRVLKNRKNGKGRMLLRSEGGGKVLLNVAIVKNVTYQLRDRACLIIPDFSSQGGRKTWGCRVGKAQNGDSMRNAVTVIQSGLS